MCSRFEFSFFSYSNTFLSFLCHQEKAVQTIVFSAMLWVFRLKNGTAFPSSINLVFIWWRKEWTIWKCRIEDFPFTSGASIPVSFKFPALKWTFVLTNCLGNMRKDSINSIKYKASTQNKQLSVLWATKISLISSMMSGLIGNPCLRLDSINDRTKPSSMSIAIFSKIIAPRSKSIEIILQWIDNEHEKILIDFINVLKRTEASGLGIAQCRLILINWISLFEWTSSKSSELMKISILI